jgi:hypothetical protein
MWCWPFSAGRQAFEGIDVMTVNGDSPEGSDLLHDPLWHQQRS